MTPEEMKAKEFADHLNKALDQLGWTTKGRVGNLTRAIGDAEITEDVVRGWLMGRDMPRVPQLAKLSRITQKSAQWLLTGESQHPEDLLPPKPNRKIIQINAIGEDRTELIALCEDGTVWSRKGTGQEVGWEQIPGPV
ncbi:hypothetical protein JFQ88_004097 [Aeromonas dhakensis]|nr:hypothetical protein [Aeromonas dhakensis]